MNIKITLNKDTDIYKQIYLYFKEEILVERFKVNDKLPSIRQIANKLKINNITVLKAYSLLETDGYIYKVKGSGSFVKNINLNNTCTLQKPILENFKGGQIKINSNINFASATPNKEIFPTKIFQNIISDLFLGDAPDLFIYEDSQGNFDLRKNIANLLKKEIKNISHREIQIINGAQQGLDLLKKGIIKNSSTIVLGSPTYSSAITTFSNFCKIKTVPVQADGFDMAALEDLLRSSKIDYIYVMTNFQSPTGYKWSKDKKTKLLNLAEEYNFYILEDDCLSELYYHDISTSSIKSIDFNDKVFYINTFSKVIMPGLRLGYLIPPKKFISSVINSKFISDISSCNLSQKSLNVFLENHYEEHLSKIRSFYKKKYELVKSLIFKSKFLKLDYLPEGGFYFWVSIVNNLNCDLLYMKFKERGVNVLPGNVFFYKKTSSNKIRISFAAVSEDEIILGFKIIEETIYEIIHEGENTYTPLI
ncbi:PLP-dependent aminotransferase family protein [Psychrilyobacter atlanticus]|uniref:aminotransferase-like domain-containing protein n=1 Tax=Psychrilyobacter atlanticus TaxID=271091 RepID=UPI000414ED0D|nr:PLP-dependent aminotransferase family protein [Psychrilyobacter atlanticus]